MGMTDTVGVQDPKTMANTALRVTREPPPDPGEKTDFSAHPSDNHSHADCPVCRTWQTRFTPRGLWSSRRARLACSELRHSERDYTRKGTLCLIKLELKSHVVKWLRELVLSHQKEVDVRGSALPRAQRRRKPQARTDRAGLSQGLLRRNTVTSFLRMKEMCQNNLKRLKYIFIIPGPKAITVVNRVLSHYDTGQLQTPLLG